MKWPVYEEGNEVSVKRVGFWGGGESVFVCGGGCEIADRSSGADAAGCVVCGGR